MYREIEDISTGARFSGQMTSKAVTKKVSVRLLQSPVSESQQKES